MVVRFLRLCSLCGASVSRTWVCRVRLCSRAVVGAGSMRSLLSGAAIGGTGTESQNRTPKNSNFYLIKRCVKISHK